MRVSASNDPKRVRASTREHARARASTRYSRVEVTLLAHGTLSHLLFLKSISKRGGGAKWLKTKAVAFFLCCISFLAISFINIRWLANKWEVDEHIQWSEKMRSHLYALYIYVFIMLCKHGCDVTACSPVLFYKRNRKWTPLHVCTTWWKHSRERESLGELESTDVNPRLRLGFTAHINFQILPNSLSLVSASGNMNSGGYFLFLKYHLYRLWKIQVLRMNLKELTRYACTPRGSPRHRCSLVQKKPRSILEAFGVVF